MSQLQQESPEELQAMHQVLTGEKTLGICSTHGNCSNFSLSRNTCSFLLHGYMNICVTRWLSQMFMPENPLSVRCVKDFVTLALCLLRIDYV